MDFVWIRLRKAADLARKATELLQPLPMQVQLAPQGEGQKWSEMTEMDRIGQKLQRVITSLVVFIICFNIIQYRCPLHVQLPRSTSRFKCPY